MNREIKFRALTATTLRKFVYGYFAKIGRRSIIFNADGEYDVDPETVGQFTGQHARNGKAIYEGDIVKDEYNRILLVEWWKCGFGFKALCETNFIRANNIMEWFEGDTPKPEIIGNVIQNPELKTFTPTP